jgi:hypothetical protein
MLKKLHFSGILSGQTMELYKIRDLQKDSGGEEDIDVNSAIAEL